MPLRKPKLTLIKQAAYQTQLSRLKGLGILPRSAGEHPDVPKNLRLSLWHGDVAQVCELLSGQIAVILPVEVMALRNDVVILDCEITLLGETLELDLEYSENNPYYTHLVSLMYQGLPTILNRWLSGEHPLPKRKLDGVILGYASMPIRPDYPDEMPVNGRLRLTDQRRAEYRLDFRAFLDRSITRTYEKKMRQERAERFPLSQRPGLFAPARSEQNGASSLRVKRDDRGPNLGGNVAKHFETTMARIGSDTRKPRT